MPKAKSIVRYLKENAWMFGRDKQRQRIEQLRRAYGDLCWRCGHPMTFGNPLSRKRATIEHLLPRSQGGTSEWANIRLCHVGCNRHLGVNPPDQKKRMRLAEARAKVPEFRKR